MSINEQFNQNLYLVDLLKPLNYEPIRAGFGRGLKKAGLINNNVVAACADLTESTQMNLFKEQFPERFFEIGVAEQNLVTLGSGLAALNKIPFVSSYAAFSPGRNWEQIRTTICLNDRPVKIVGSHAGVSVGPDGATHQMLEDIALMRVLPNMKVFAPADSVEAEKITLAMSSDPKPNYIRLAREKTAIITTEKTPFQIGQGYILTEGGDISLMATGTMSAQALLASELLYKEGIDAEVIHLPTIKPLDEQTILRSAMKTRKVITIEEAQVNGGFGSAVAEVLSENYPVRMKRLGIYDRFGESGSPDQLIKFFKLDSQGIKEQVLSFLKSF